MAMEVKSASPAGDCAFSADGYLPADRPSFGSRNEETRVSPDILPLANGRKPIPRAWKEDADADHSSRSTSHSALDGKSIRARSVSAGPSPTRDHQFPRLSFPSDSPPSATHSDTQPLPITVPKTQSRHHEIINGVGDEVLLQWGHNKRSRKPRSESRASGDESSAHSRQMLKVPRRSAAAAAAAAAAMPPPPLSYSRGSNPRTTSMPVRDAKKNVEEPSNGPSRSDKRSPSSSPDKPSTDCPVNTPVPKQPAEAAVLAIGEKLSLDQFEWPKIYVSLSRKEKEDDFLAIKGTKLPQRPKKRAKNVDKILQYCFPGMWLSDLSKGRYEVREKKCVKKRRRGLKGMESMDSDSE